jgi:acetyl esterase
MQPLAPGMRRLGRIVRRLVAASGADKVATGPRSSRPNAVPDGIASILMGTSPKNVKIQTRTVEGIRRRIYTPTRESSSRPLVVYFHGGGFVSGDLRMGDWMCGAVAGDLDAVVVSIEYRLAPEHPFPAGLEDCYAGLLWAVEHAAEFGAERERLGVMGESAGGNLAAVVALMARDSGAPVIRHQALLYPATGAGDTESRRTNADAYILTAADMRRYAELYGGDPKDWRVSPLRAKSLEGLPPTLIAVAGHDPLHDDGVLYAEALRAAGVDVRLLDFPAMPHGFLNFPRFAKDAKAGMDAVVEAQRVALR